MSKKTLILVATIIGSGMAVLDGFVVTLALPKIAADLNANFADLQWIVDAYLLSLSSLILVGGSLGDIFGRKRIYLIGLTGFTVSSVLCGVAPNIEFLIAFRILQGVFGALLVPAGLAIINTNFDRAERGKAIGSWSAWLAIVVPIGPLVGGYLLSISSWRWIFFINLPLGLICGYLASKYFVESRAPGQRSLDYVGVGLTTVALAGITYGLIEGPSDHWHARSIAALVVGVLAAFTFLWYERQAKDPLLQLRLFKSRNFSGSNIMTFAMYGALGGFTFIMPIYLQTKIGYSPLKAGLSILPISLALFFLSSRMGSLSSKFGPKYFLTIGPLLVALAIFLFFGYKPGDDYLTFFFPRILIFGIGMGILVAPLTTTVMTSVEETSSGIASGINNAVSRIAGLIVVALLGLAGAENVYHFSIWLCGFLALFAGVISFLLIQNHPKPLKLK